MAAADYVLEHLRIAKVTRVGLAKKLGIDPSLASMMLTGKRGIPIWHLDGIADLLGMTIPELFLPSDPACHSGVGDSTVGGTPDAVALARLRREHDRLRKDIHAVANAAFRLVHKYQIESPDVPSATSAKSKKHAG